MISNLAKNNCEPCGSKAAPLNGDALRQMQNQVGGGWRIVGERRLEKRFLFSDFRRALDFTLRVGEIAEAQGHHPDIFLSGDEVRLQIRAQETIGLTESDFILAAKVNEIK